MKVTNLIEHEDGSATVNLEMTDKEKALLIQVGFVQALKDSIAVEEAEKLLRGTDGTCSK